MNFSRHRTRAREQDEIRGILRSRGWEAEPGGTVSLAFSHPHRPELLLLQAPETEGHVFRANNGPINALLSGPDDTEIAHVDDIRPDQLEAMLDD